ncbi:hypothetical protein Tco_0063067, partial [Tanacetum coccineum]
EYHEVHEMQTDEQHNYVVDSDADYTSNSNIIPYDQYVEDNEDHVVQSNVSSVRNDSEDLGKFQAKADIGIFVGYAPSMKGYRIYNKRTRRLMETIHVTFDEMHQTMTPVRISSGPEPKMNGSYTH